MDRYQHTCRVCGWQATRTEALGYCESCAERRPAVIRVTASARLIGSAPSTTPTRRPLLALVPRSHEAHEAHEAHDHGPELPPAA